MTTPILSPDSANLKRCSQCGELKPATREFFRISKARLTYCKQCQRKRNRAYYEANRERLLECASEYRLTHREEAAAGVRRRRARQAQAPGQFTAEDLASIRAAQTDKKGRLICWRCRKPITDTPHLDHFIPLDKGGSNDPGNLHYMHAKCNLNKSNRHPHELGMLI